MIYLDYAATTPVDPIVARVMAECLQSESDFGNAASATHAYGKRAEMLVETARRQVAALIGADPAEITFTSGATESNNLAILGITRANADRGRHIVTSRIEHKSVLDPCKALEKEGFSVTYITPDRSGRVGAEAVRAALRPDTLLVSIMHVNNEIGVIQDIAAIGAICRERDVLFHSDAAQSIGKLPIDVRTLPVDLLSLTAHKIYGPKGVGALYVRREKRPWLRPITFGGGQERGLRPGTLPTHQIVGFGTACELAARNRAAHQERLEALNARLWQGLASLDGVHLNGAEAPRVPNILNVSFEGVEGESLVTGLTSLAVATGSACTSATGEPSYVLRALGRSSQLAQASLRLSLGKQTSEADVDTAVALIRKEVLRLRAASPANTSGSVPEPGEEPQSVITDSLSGLIRRYFRELPGVGILTGPADAIVQGEAGSIDDEVWVRFHLQIAEGTVKDARFQAFGCPHTLATAAWVTGQLPGRALSDLVPGTPQAWAQALQVPTEKLGRLLVVEDALRACQQTH